AACALVAVKLARVLGESTLAQQLLHVAAEWATDIESHLQIVEERVGLQAASEVEQAVARQDWQVAYDRAMQLPLGDTSTLAQLLLVSENLQELGAADAALDLIDRTMNVYAPTS